MLYKKRIVQEDVPVETQIVTPVAQPVVEHTTTIERDSMGGGTAIAVILAGLIVIALVGYFAWYQPQNTVVTQPAASTTVIDHENGAAAQPVVTNPAPTTIVNPPAINPTPNTTIVNPPANNTTVVNPPAGSSSTTTDNGDGTSTTTTNRTTTTTSPGNNGG